MEIADFLAHLFYTVICLPVVQSFGVRADCLSIIKAYQKSTVSSFVQNIG